MNTLTLLRAYDIARTQMEWAADRHGGGTGISTDRALATSSAARDYERLRRISLKLYVVISRRLGGPNHAGFCMVCGTYHIGKRVEHAEIIHRDKPEPVKEVTS